ncbi:MAG: hypothetical protein EOP46_20780 [Sphingobacteriaceae bacterium]|nr:MAG: hypothetical protein EOP46_20780 [Sphingobacteriaceae bacterium]
MQKLIYYTALFVMQLAGIGALNAQTKTTTKSATERSVKEDGKITAEASISASTSDTSYALKATFDKHRTNDVRNLIVREMGKQTNGNSDKWNWKQEFKGSTAYNITLSNGKLKMSANGPMLPKDTFDKFKMLGARVTAMLSKE